MSTVRTDLPVYQHKGVILDALENNQVIVIESPTGSGKTTQLPLILKEAGFDSSGIIGVTQPRRIATLSVSEYIKKQLGNDDSYVAYTMRFHDTSDENTRIKIMTDGILLQELKSDPYLSKYSVMMIDEAHERSLNIDFILGLLKQICEVRTDLKVIISSATINTQTFSKFFNNAPIISIDAKVHPIDIIYMPPQHANNKDEIDFIIEKIVKDSVEKQNGDILIFQPGEYDIVQTELNLRSLPIKKKLQIYPLYGRLSKEDQEKVFTPTEQGKTKVVIATNIAETSITIDGITTVIDTGVAKINFYNQKTFTSSLVPLPISKSQASQRAGRSGRTQPGTCFRLYSEQDLKMRNDYATEEILRSDLAEVVLRMSDLKIYNYEKFPFITSPKMSSIKSAEETLRFINAIDDNRMLTSIGEKMVLFPLLPRHSRVLVEAMYNYPDVLNEVIIAVSFLSTKGPYLLPKGEEDLAREKQKVFSDPQYGDFVSYLRLFKTYERIDNYKTQEKFCKKYFLDLQTMNEIVHINEQLADLVSRQGLPLTGGGAVGDYLTCLAAGLLQYVCYNSERYTYRTLTTDQIYIHPGSAWFKHLPKFILAGEIVQTSRMFARTVSPLKVEWLNRIDPTLKDRLMGRKALPKERNAKIEKEEKTIEVDKNSIEIFGKVYPVVPSKKKKDNKKVALVPLSDIKYLIDKGFEKGKVKKMDILLQVNGINASRKIKLKNLVQEGRLIKTDRVITSNEIRSYFFPDELEQLIKALDLLFRPVVNKKKTSFNYIGLDMYSENTFGLVSVADLQNTLDITYATLTALNAMIDKNDKAKRQIINKLINEIDDLQDF